MNLTSIDIPKKRNEDDKIKVTYSLPCSLNQKKALDEMKEFGFDVNKSLREFTDILIKQHHAQKTKAG